MKIGFSPILFFLLSTSAIAQTQVSGKITDQKNQLIPGANIYIKDTYDGATSNAQGEFSFSTVETEERILVASFIGYLPFEQKINLSGGELTVNIILKQSVKELDMVTISAGSFEASDEKKSVILSSLDIVTTAGAAGDIYGALQTLPGTQQIGESEGLFVRGGAASEAKTIIDGMVVPHPYYSSVPDISQRGRFSPFLFKGTVFSTGGYSAEYGQAMSSALVLETQDLAEKNTSNIGLMTVGGSASHYHRWKNTSLGGDINYTNLTPYYATVKQNTDWYYYPQAGGGSLAFRQKTSSTGLLKVYGYYNASHLAMYSLDLNSPSGSKNRFELKNQNTYINTSFKNIVGKNWSLYSGASYATNNDDMRIGRDSVQENDAMVQGKIRLVRQLGGLSTLKFGGEVWSYFNHLHYKNPYVSYQKNIDDLYASGFAETELFFTSKLAARVGGRFEHSGAIGASNVAPRASVAYKTGDKSQLSLAYGDYYQTPDKEFLRGTDPLRFEKATHYIFNFQHMDNSRTFRVEGYYKSYHRLLRTVPDTLNTGSGYAKGVDLFWRDKKTIKYVDYWVSYSYLDTKRLYRDYPVKATPVYAATHTMSVVYKQYIPKVTSNVGFTYVFATGRPYYNPNNPVFLGDHTRSYHNLSVNWNYLTSIAGNFTVVVLSAGNVLGIENIYGYRYSADGSRSMAVTSPASRSFFVGVFISIGSDEFEP